MNQANVETRAAVHRKRNRKSRRSTIRDVSLRLFAEKGFDRTGLKDIADELGITHPALYHYYQSKNEILFDAVSATMRQLVAVLREALEEQGEATPRERIRCLAKHQIGFQLDVKGLVPLVDSVLFGPLSAAKVIDEDGRKELIGIQRELTELYRREVDTGLRDGSFQVDSAAAACFSVLGSISYVVYWFREDGSRSREEIAEIVADLCVSSLQKPGD